MKKLLGILCVLVLSWWAIKPLLSPGYFPMHDDTQVARVVVMGKALQEGQFPVRWVSDLGYGYGYPIFNFYGPLPYYVGGALYAMGMDSVVATKLMFALGMLLAPIGMFLFTHTLFGFFAGMTASVLFMYAPYHAVQAYIRGSVGEYWAIAFVPLILYGMQLSGRETGRKKGILLGAIAYACVITSHTITGYITTGLLALALLVVIAIQRRKPQRGKNTTQSFGAIVFGGIGLAGFFWLPAFVEMSATSVSGMIQSATTSFIDHFVCPAQFINSPWGFAGSAPGCVDGLSFKLGKPQIGALLFSIVIWLMTWKNRKFSTKRKFFYASFLGLLLCLFLMTSSSAFFWDKIPLREYIQYPWRLLTFAMLCIAVAGAYGISVLRMPIAKIVVSLGLIVTTIAVSTRIFKPQYTYLRDTRAFQTAEELRFAKSKISDEYLPPDLIKPKSVTDIVQTAIEGQRAFLVKGLKENDTRLEIELESNSSQTITLKRAWFPGWQLKVNGTRVTPTIIFGLPSVNIPAGQSIIQMRFVDTPIRVIGNMVSLITACALGVIYGKRKKTNS